MNVVRWIACVVVLSGSTISMADSGPLRDPSNPFSLPTSLRFCTKHEVERINRDLGGQLLDFTFNHKVDRRQYSKALDSKRDLYVYLPPKYDPGYAYPFMLYLHGFAQDERHFLDLVSYLDAAIVRGDLPPMIVAAPDGSIDGRPTILQAGSFYLNSKAGNFEDYIVLDVWNFVVEHFAVRPERECHLLLGSSMGGFGAYNLGIKYRDRFAVVAGIHPPLNLRYCDCKGRYFADFDPNCTSYREEYRPLAPVARFYGVIPIRQRQLVKPLFERNQDIMGDMAKQNPVEMLDAYDVKPGELAMFAAYGGRDQFNIDAQIESFVAVAQRRGLTVTTVKDPRGDHSTVTGLKLFPSFCAWVTPLLKDYPPIQCPKNR